jgi:phosphoribosylanthranilate isomerase
MAQLRVKVCGMRQGENLRELCALNPDYVGFIFVRESPRYFGDELSESLLSAVPQGIKTVGVFRDEPIELLVQRVRQLSLRGIQLHGSEQSEYIAEVRRYLPEVEVLKAVSVSKVEDVMQLSTIPGVDLFLFDSGSGGTGFQFDWGIVRSYQGATPFLLAGGIAPKDVGAVQELAKQVPQLCGVDINSKVEVSPGVKDMALVGQVIRGVRGV